MKYFKNIELAKLYHVSEKSVRNWISAAQDGKLNLHLHTEKGKMYIANTSQNTRQIEELVNKGKKYKNTRGFKTITPKKEFYDLYSSKQIWDIILNFAIHHESPLQYGYVNGGAEEWDEYTQRLAHEKSPNILNSTVDLLQMAMDNLQELTSKYDKINIIDLGPGNGLPVRSLLERLTQENRLGRYIAVDISQDMLSILEKNIKNWFGDSIAFETHLRDITYERFNDILSEAFASGNTANIILFLGGTLANFREPSQVLQTINNSMGPDDVLLYSGYLDTPTTRRYFDYYTSDQKVPAQDGLLLYFFNIDDSLYDVELSFNEKERARTISIRPKVDISIAFEFNTGTRNLELRKGEPILLWRHLHYTFPDLVQLFDFNNFDIQQLTKSKDQNYLLLTSRLKIKSSIA